MEFGSVVHDTPSMPSYTGGALEGDGCFGGDKLRTRLAVGVPFAPGQTAAILTHEGQLPIAHKGWPYLVELGRRSRSVLRPRRTCSCPKQTLELNIAAVDDFDLCKF